MKEKSCDSDSSDDFRRFEELARKLVAVPKKEIQKRESSSKDKRKDGKRSRS